MKTKTVSGAALVLTLLLGACGSVPPTNQEEEPKAVGTPNTAAVQGWVPPLGNQDPQRVIRASAIREKLKNSLKSTGIEVVPTNYTYHDFPNEYYSSGLSNEGQMLFDAVQRGEFNEYFEGDVYYGGSLSNQATDLTSQAYTINEQIDIMRSIHRNSLSNFLYHRNNRIHANFLVYDTDGCSVIGDANEYRDFTSPCYRHDFGYRNYQKFDLFTLQSQDEIDIILLNDMRAECVSRWGSNLSFGRTTCYTAAYLAYSSLYFVAPLHPNRDD